LIGAVLTQMASILDGNDGELARLRITDSDYGTWLDTLCDYVSYFLTFGGIVLGLYQRSGTAAYLWLGAFIFAGFGLSMLALSYLRRYRVPRGQAGKLSSLAISTLESNAASDWISLWSKRLRHFATRAVFSYFLILFGLLDLWGLVLVLAAIGSHLVWIGCLYHSKHIRVPEREAQLGNQ
jgi:phosphatidylglycerophosphate synthase